MPTETNTVAIQTAVKGCKYTDEMGGSLTTAFKISPEVNTQNRPIVVMGTYNDICPAKTSMEEITMPDNSRNILYAVLLRRSGRGKKYASFSMAVCNCPTCTYNI